LVAPGFTVHLPTSRGHIRLIYRAIPIYPILLKNKFQDLSLSTKHEGVVYVFKFIPKKTLDVANRSIQKSTPYHGFHDIDRFAAIVWRLCHGRSGLRLADTAGTG
jgi:hypothetical protein